MKNQTCSACSVPMIIVQIIGSGSDDVALCRCAECFKEVFVGHFTFHPTVISHSSARAVGFGDARVPSRASHKGGVW